MNEMLGRLIRLVVKVPSEMLGALCDLVEKLASNRGGEWYEALTHFLRREPCWIANLIKPVNVVTETVKRVKTYLRRLFTFTLGPMNDTNTYAMVGKTFRVYFDPNFEKCGVVFLRVVSTTEIAIDELIEDGKFSDFLGSTAVELEKRRLTGSQFLAICRVNPDKLRGEGFANFFVLTKGDEVVAEDLSNVFVADVYARDGINLVASLYEVWHDHVWGSNYRHRIFSPQQ